MAVGEEVKRGDGDFRSGQVSADGPSSALEAYLSSLLLAQRPTHSTNRDELRSKP
jgi:hypothetical protein